MLRIYEKVYGNRHPYYVENLDYMADILSRMVRQLAVLTLVSAKYDYRRGEIRTRPSMERRPSEQLKLVMARITRRLRAFESIGSEEDAAKLTLAAVLTYRLLD